MNLHKGNISIVISLEKIEGKAVYTLSERHPETENMTGFEYNDKLSAGVPRSTSSGDVVVFVKITM